MEECKVKSLSLEPMLAFITTDGSKRMQVPIIEDEHLITPGINGMTQDGVIDMHKYYLNQIKECVKENTAHFDGVYNLGSITDIQAVNYTGVHIGNIINVAWWLAYDYNYEYEDKELYLYLSGDDIAMVSYIDEDGDDHWTIASFEDGKYTKIFNNEKHDETIDLENVVSFIKIDSMLAKCMLQLTIGNGVWTPFPEE